MNKAMLQAKTSVQMEGHIIGSAHSELVRLVIEGALSEKKFTEALLNMVRNKP